MKKNINGYEQVIQTRAIDKEEVMSLIFGLIEKKNKIIVAKYSIIQVQQSSHGSGEFFPFIFLSNYSSVVLFLIRPK